MIFPYTAIIAESPDGSDFLLLRRPEIPVTVVGAVRSAAFIGLVDTGSDQTILPKSIADYLGIALEPTTGPAARTFGGHSVRLLAGDVVFKLEADGESLIWKTPVAFFDFPAKDDETLILGHSGFLDYFTATFDGKLGVLTLNPNDDLPAGI